MLKFEQDEMLKANRENRTPIEYSMTFLRERVNNVLPGRTNTPTARGEIAAVFHSADGCLLYTSPQVTPMLSAFSNW